MFKLTPNLPLGGASRSWSGFAVEESYEGELVSVAFSDENTKALKSRFKKTFGVSLPTPNAVVHIQGGLSFWSGPDQIMLLLDGENINADKDVEAKLEGLAYTTLQSDSWASINISGERVYDVLERFIALDLRSAPAGFAARSSAHHMAVIVLKMSETEFKLLTPRSSAGSFYDALCHTAENAL